MEGRKWRGVLSGEDAMPGRNKFEKSKGKVFKTVYMEVYGRMGRRLEGCREAYRLYEGHKK